MQEKIKEHVLWALLSYMRPYKRQALFAGFVLVLSSLNLLVLPISARYMMDFGFVKESQENITYYVYSPFFQYSLR